MTRPTSDGIEIEPTRRVARIQTSAIRSRSSLICENAGKKTCCSGAAIRENGTRITFVASAYTPERRGAEEAADQQAAEVATGLVEQVLAEDVARKAAESPQARRRRTSNDGRHGVRYQRSARRRDRLRELLADDRPGSAVSERDRDADDSADECCRDLAELEPSELHVAHEQRHVRRPECADEEAERDDDEERPDFGLAVEARQRACERDAAPRASDTPTPALVQKTVERSPRWRSRRWMSAVPERVVRERRPRSPRRRAPSRPDPSRAARAAAPG